MNSTIENFPRLIITKESAVNGEEHTHYVMTRVCCKDESLPHLACGCPSCLKRQGLTVVYDAKRWEELHVGTEPSQRKHCPVRVVKQETAKHVPWLIQDDYK